mgnify:CR=1 FL=1
MKRLLMTGLVLASPLVAHAQLSFEDIDRAAAAVQPQVVEWRRWFHENPELSNQEFNTASRIAGILADMGLEPTTGIAGTGVMAMIEGGKPGPLVAVIAFVVLTFGPLSRRFDGRVRRLAGDHHLIDSVRERLEGVEGHDRGRGRPRADRGRRPLRHQRRAPGAGHQGRRRQRHPHQGEPDRDHHRDHDLARLVLDDQILQLQCQGRRAHSCCRLQLKVQMGSRRAS